MKPAPPVITKFGLDAVIVFFSFRTKSRNPAAQLTGNTAGCLDFARHDNGTRQVIK